MGKSGYFLGLPETGAFFEGPSDFCYCFGFVNICIFRVSRLKMGKLSQIFKKIICNTLLFGYEYLVNHFLGGILSRSIFLGVKILTSEEHLYQENTCVPSALDFRQVLFRRLIMLSAGFFGICMEL